jgi:membrane protein
MHRVAHWGKVAFDLVKQTVNAWLEDKAQRMGASLAYYTVFSLAPLLVIALAVAAMIFGDQAASQIQQEIGATVGGPVAGAIGQMIQHAKNPASGTIATMIGIVVLLFGASGVFGELQDALNTVWQVQPRPGRGLMGVLRDRFFSFSMVLGSCFLLLVSLIVTTALSAVSRYTSGLPGGDVLWQIVNALVSFAIIALIFALIFKVVPDVKIGWGDVWVGAVVTAVLFTAGKYALSVYLASESVTSPYGAAGSLVIILLWVYYSSQILLFGAEFARVYASNYGTRVKPSANAVPLTPKDRAAQGIPTNAQLEADARKQQKQPA